MSSRQRSGGGGTDYEPSDYADEFSEDPAKILAKGEEMAVARINGISDPDLLQAYLDVEVDRQARGDVIGAINQRKATLKTCPRGCDAPIHRRFELPGDDDGVQITHQNAVWDKTCIVPSDDGATTVVLHGEPPSTDGEEEAEEDPEPAEEGTPDEDDRPTGQSAKRLYDKLTASDQAMTLASIKGWAGTELGLSPDEAKLTVDTLVNGGYAEEIEDGVYKATS